ncbi:hypothetical protein ACTXT7_002061 [Hymenolepis weldensis]
MNNLLQEMLYLRHRRHNCINNFNLSGGITKLIIDVEVTERGRQVINVELSVLYIDLESRDMYTKKLRFKTIIPLSLSALIFPDHSPKEGDKVLQPFLLHT